MKKQFLISVCFCFLLSACDAESIREVIKVLDETPTPSASSLPEIVASPTAPPIDKKQVIATMHGNMRQIQTMTETYFVDWAVYPATLDALFKEAVFGKNPYFKPIGNPVTGVIWDQENPSGKGVIVESSELCEPGIIFYKINSDNTVYLIGGCDADNNPLEIDLTNG